MQEEELNLEVVNNVYTLTSPDSNIVVKIVLNTNYNDYTISSISVQGDERWVNEWSDSEEESDEYSNVDLDVSVNFSYENPVITFPTIEKKDFDITGFYKMFLEIEKADIVAEQKENQFYLNLNKFSGNADDAVKYLKENGTKLDIEFVNNYIKTAKNLNLHIRLRDLKELSVYGLDDWDIKYLYDDIKYDVNEYFSNNEYDDKYVLETLLEAFDESGAYHTIDWDVYDKLNISIDRRGDIVILLAKMRTAEKLRGAE